MDYSPQVNGGDDEFVVPHMDITCLQNSLAYRKVLEEPWTYLHNWSNLSPSVQQELVQNFLSTLGELKMETAVTQGVFDPYAVNMQVNQQSQPVADGADGLAATDVPSPQVDEAGTANE